VQTEISDWGGLMLLWSRSEANGDCLKDEAGRLNLPSAIRVRDGKQFADLWLESLGEIEGKIIRAYDNASNGAFSMEWVLQKGLYVFYLAIR